MVLKSLLILIPSLAGFFWLFAYKFFAPKDELFHKLKRFIAILSCFFLFAFLSADPSSRLALHFTLFEQVFALSIVPCFISYVNEYSGETKRSLLLRFCNMIPIVHLVVGIESVYTAGFHNAVKILLETISTRGPLFPFLDNDGQRVFYACYTYMFGTFLLIDFFVFAVNLMSCVIKGECHFTDVLRFFFKRDVRLGLMPVQFFVNLIILLTIIPALLLGRRCYVDSVLITIGACLFLGLFVCLTGFLGAAGHQRKISFSGLMNQLRFGDRESRMADADDAADGTPDVAVPKDAKAAPYYAMVSVPVPEGRAHGAGLSQESFGIDFEKFMLEDRMFLRPDISLSSAAESLGVTKDDLSDYMDATYGMSFSNYLNMLRVDYAEQYILDHDNATQKEIAVACGYSGASAFNSAFSKLTGVTPKIWKDRYSEMTRRKRT